MTALYASLLSVAAASVQSPAGSVVPPPPAPGVQANVVFGRYGGLALLMDVHRPARPNGRGIVYVPGSGFHRPAGYGARPITGYTKPWVPALVEAGYTVFVVNHRAAPAFRHPAALEDAQRAVRYVRQVALEYGIAPDRLGAGGYSSGATLASLLGVLEATADGINPEINPDPVERHSPRVQCVMAGGGAYDFTSLKTPVGVSASSSYLGMSIELGYPEEGVEYRTFQHASPAFHASPGDAPHLLIHGDADDLLPFAQAETMLNALQKAGVAATLLRIPGGTHGNLTPRGAPDFLGEMVRFFDRCLSSR